MKITYELSGRQRKELIERGRRLWIALPAPDDSDSPGFAPLAFARASLPTLEAEWIRSAELDSAPINLGKRDPGAGLAGLVGPILTPEEERLGYWHLWVEIVSVEIVAGKPRQADSQLAWPGGEVRR